MGLFAVMAFVIHLLSKRMKKVSQEERVCKEKNNFIKKCSNSWCG